MPSSTDYDISLSPELRQDIEKLFDEFILSFLEVPKGKKHINSYLKGRIEAQKSYETIKEALSQGQDITYLGDVVS